MSRVLGCEQCGAAQPAILNRYRGGRYVPAPRERSKCCQMLLCGRCIKTNGHCFACEEPGERDERLQDQARERRAAASPALLAACKRALSTFKPFEEDDPPHPTIAATCDQLREAIALAEVKS